MVGIWVLRKSKMHLSDSLQPHGLFSPWNSPGQNTGVGSLFLLQGIFPTQESNLGLLHCKGIVYQLSHREAKNLTLVVCFLLRLKRERKNVWPLQPISSIWRPPSLPVCYPLTSIRVFSNESVLCIRWPKYWSFNFSISPSNVYSGLISFRIDWLDLLAVQGTLKSLL